MNCIKHFQEQFIYVSTINMMVSLFLIKRPHTFTSCIWHTTTFTVGSFLTPKTFIIRAASLSVIRSKGILTITALFIQSLVMIFHTLFIVFLLILQTQKGYHLWTWALGRVQPQHRGFRIHFWGGTPGNLCINYHNLTLSTPWKILSFSGYIANSQSCLKTLL